jgi:hypothetical protein
MKNKFNVPLVRLFGNLNRARSAFANAVCAVHLLIIALVAVIGLTIAACDNGGGGGGSGSGDDLVSYKVTATSSGQVTFKVRGLTVTFTTNIPDNAKFTLNQGSSPKVITGLTPKAEYEFSFPKSVGRWAVESDELSSGVVSVYKF